MAAITLKIGSPAVVFIDNPDGTLNRLVSLTAKEAAQIKASPNQWPSACTQKEWESGLARMIDDPNGVLAQQGDMRVFADGNCVIYTGTGYMSMLKSDYTGTPPLITTATPISGTVSSLSGVTAIVDGVMTTMDVVAVG